MTKIVAAIFAKNEAHIIGRCIRSVAPYVSSVVLSDTGSTDATIATAQHTCEEIGLPLRVAVHPWQNYGVNSGLAFETARSLGDYVWMLDADHVVTPTGDIDLRDLTAPGYAACRLLNGDWEVWFPTILRSDVGWHYVGERHAVPSGGCTAKLRGLDVLHKNDGASSKKSPEDQRARFELDVNFFQAELDANPGNGRAAYYLAQSLHDAGRTQEACGAYRRRAAIRSDNEEEAYQSLLMIAWYSLCFGEPEIVVDDALRRAYERRPTRAEAAFSLAERCNHRGEYAQAIEWCDRAIAASNTDDRFLVRRSVHTWRPRVERACALERLERSLKSAA